MLWVVWVGIVLPAHAGVILYTNRLDFTLYGITRTCGGDPTSIPLVLELL